MKKKEGTARLKGTCAYCGIKYAKNTMPKHLVNCERRKCSIAKAETGKRKTEALYHLRMQALGRDEFWLDIEMRGSAVLKDLDSYLRAIWLDCCGHLSQFSRGRGYSDVIPKNHGIGDVVRARGKMTHVYDFGTPSETLIMVTGIRQGKPATTRPITLMARNLMPAYKCTECKKLAVWLCMECHIEKETWGTLCEGHMTTHQHDDYGGPMRLVNSPRLGLCGYDGSAKPPY